MYDIEFMAKLKNFDIDKYELLDMARHINNETGKLDEFNYEINEDVFFDEYLDFSRSELNEKLWSGSYNYNDKYVRLNVYNNIVSISEDELAILADSMKDEILNQYLEYVDDYGVDFFNLEDNLEDYTNNKEFIEELKEKYFKN